MTKTAIAAHEMKLKEKRKKIGIIKRKTKALAKQLVKEFEEVGIYENFGSSEISLIKTEIVSIRLNYRIESEIFTDLSRLINTTADILFANGLGRTNNQAQRTQLAKEAMDYILDYKFNRSILQYL